MKKIIVRWRDIPAQVIVKHRGQRATVALSARFQEAIDHVAMHAGKADSDAYMDDWHRDASPLAGVGSLQAVAQQLADDIELNYSDEVLSKIIVDAGYRVT